MLQFKAQELDYINCEQPGLDRETGQLIIPEMQDFQQASMINLSHDEDILGRQAERKINNDKWQVFVKPLANGDIALGILNSSDKTQTIQLNLSELGIVNKTKGFDVWTKTSTKIGNNLRLEVASHETKVYRLSM